MTRQEIQHVMSLWEIEYKTLKVVVADKRGELVVEPIKVNLLERDSIHALVEKYFGGNDWCLTIAKQVQPNLTWRTGLSVFVDAAYYIRAREIEYS